MWKDFVQRLSDIQQNGGQAVVLRLNPRVDRMPFPIQRYDDPLFPFSKAIIQSTRSVVGAYLFDLAAYLALGAAGAIALERSIGYVGRDTPTILHGPFVGHDYSEMADQTAFAVDAITVLDCSDLTYYLNNPPYGAFLSCEVAVAADIERGGIVDFESNRCVVNNSECEPLEFKITTDDILYAGVGDSFAEETQRAIERLLTS